MKSLLLAILAAGLLFGDPLSETFARMDKTAQSFRGMTADLKQTAHTAIVNDDSTESGIIRLKRMKGSETRILVDFTSPDLKTIAVEGDEVRIWLHKANVEQVYEIGNKRAALDQAMLLGFGASSAEIKSRYDVTFVGAEPINGQPTSHIRLVPKDKEVLHQLKQAELWISDTLGSPLQQKLVTSNGGDYTLFTYSNLKFTGSLSDKDLRLNPPKNVQIEHVGK